jgi:peptidyl-tRNA hydrolase, PTH1 family
MTGVPLKLIVGLGNPGDEYSRTRHNAGFWFVDELARRHGGRFREEPRHQSELARVTIGTADVWLAKPTTYMNLSGGAVGAVASFYKLAPEQVLVAYDELDFPPGTVRLKFGGGAAGHNGIRDIIANLGDGFWRLRIGIGKPDARGAGRGHVLSRPRADDQRLIDETILAAADVIPVLLAEGGQIAMNRLHTAPDPAPEAP